MTWRFVDMHCHLDRMSNAEEVAHRRRREVSLLFSHAGYPCRHARGPRAPRRAYQRARGGGPAPLVARRRQMRCRRCRPRGKACGRASLYRRGGTRLWAARGRNTQELQIATFEGICRAIAKRSLPHRVISIHAIHAATTALDILERTGVAGTGAHPGTTVIFHWFSGSCEEFARARRLGCYFSVSEHMLKSKRGREYARQLPEGGFLRRTPRRGSTPPTAQTPSRRPSQKRSQPSQRSGACRKTRSATPLRRQVQLFLHLGAHRLQTSKHRGRRLTPKMGIKFSRRHIDRFKFSRFHSCCEAILPVYPSTRQLDAHFRIECLQSGKTYPNRRGAASRMLSTRSIMASAASCEKPKRPRAWLTR